MTKLNEGEKDKVHIADIIDPLRKPLGQIEDFRIALRTVLSGGNQLDEIKLTELLTKVDSPLIGRLIEIGYASNEPLNNEQQANEALITWLKQTVENDPQLAVTEINAQICLGRSLEAKSNSILWDKSPSNFFEKLLSPRGRTYEALHIEDIMQLFTPWYVYLSSTTYNLDGINNAAVCFTHSYTPDGFSIRTTDSYGILKNTTNTLKVKIETALRALENADFVKVPKEKSDLLAGLKWMQQEADI